MSAAKYLHQVESGIDWLGAIPANWVIKKFRHIFKESSEKIEQVAFGPMLSVSGYRGVEIKHYDDENRRRRDEDLIGYRIVRPGQLVVNTMWLNYAGLGVSDLEGHVSPAYRSYHFASGLNKKFVHYLVRSSIYVQGYTRLLTGIRPNSLQMGRDDLMEFPIICPPCADQSAIVAYLDRETSKIDALIAEQTRLIELLKEKRQAVISHAVTKGLDPDAPMKDSGVEWLGEVPGHWIVKPLKMLVTRGSSISYGIVQPGEHQDDGVPFVQTTNISAGDFSLDRLQRTSPDIAAMYPRSRIKGGEVLLGIRASIGAAHVAPSHLTGANLSRGIARIECSQEMTGLFLVAFFQSASAFKYWLASKQGSTFNEVSIETVKGLPIPVPPITEQKEICAKLSIVEKKLAGMMSSATDAVRLLEERRSALISAAVTGKIDVRGLVPEQPEAA